MFRKRVKTYIEQNRLLSDGQKVMVALSGGADSVALLRVLVSLGYTCMAAHCNFHLRGEESDRDEEFVNELCKSLQVPLFFRHFDTTGYASQQGISIEMAARNLRYEWFESLAEEEGIERIAVAHHRDDSVETILLNLIRGTGIDGLCGIRAKNGKVIRPLLDETRNDIIDYLAHLKQKYVTDSTNMQDVYTRNKIRLGILPMLKEINPSIEQGLTNTSRHLSEVAEVYHQERREAILRVTTSDEDNFKSFSIEAINKEVSPQSLLFEILSPLGFHTPRINDIFKSMNGQSGKHFKEGEWEALIDRKQLLLKKENYVLPLPKLHFEIVNLTTGFKIPKDSSIACLDASKVELPLSVRRWKEGDKFIPFGMKGNKLISDYMTDCKFNRFRKEMQCVACSGEQIVWLIGERIDNRYAITEHTRKAIIIKVLG